MLEAARGWLTPAVLFVVVNLVIATIAVASRLVGPAAAAGGDEPRRGLMRAPSLAVDRLRASLSFSRLGLAADHAPLFDDAAAAAATEPEPSPSPSPQPPAAETDRERGEDEARVERSRSEAAAPNQRRPRAVRMRRAATEEAAALAGVAGGVVEVDARADDFIRRFREQLRLQRLDSILRYRDTLRRTGTA